MTGRTERTGIIGAMSERPIADVVPIACPFVAFEHDRTRRSVEPDRRHRCYAEREAAPRAISHQVTYCLSSGFAACPTFQAWARRQAAREDGAAAPSAPPVSPRDAPPTGLPEYERDLPAGPAPTPASRRSPEWASPPPWMAEDGGIVEQLGTFDTDDGHAVAPGSTGEPPPPRWTPPPSAAGDAELAALARGEDIGDVPDFLVGRSKSARADGAASGPAPSRSVGQAKPAARTIRRPARIDADAPPWESPRRFEAYPTLRTRVGLPRVPGIILAIVALAAAALLVFILPSFLAAPGPTATPTPSVTATASPGAPTAEPLPTGQVYVVVARDTILRIARKFGVSVEDLLAANPQIKNPDKINAGDQINIPGPPVAPSQEPSASP